MSARRTVGRMAWAVAGLAIALGVRAAFDSARGPSATMPRTAAATATAPQAPAVTAPLIVANPATDTPVGGFYDVFEDGRGAVDPVAVARPTPAPATPAPARRAPASPRTPDQIFAAASPAVVLIEVSDRKFRPIGLGSGFFVSADGLLVTNHHVIVGGRHVRIRSGEDRSFLLEGVVAADVGCDLVLLKVSVAKPVAFLTVSTAPEPPVGTRVFAIGNPHGLQCTLSDGLVSALRKVNGRAYAPHEPWTQLQTTAPISPGSSGGPLLGVDGTVVGVTTSQMVGGQNLNFAVSAERVRRLMSNRGETKSLAEVGGDIRMDDIHKLDSARTAIATGDYREAGRLLEELAAEYKDHPRYWRTKGQLHTRLNNLELAAASYRKAIELKSTDIDAHFSLGGVLMKQGRHAEAIDVYRAVARIDPKRAGAYGAAGEAAAGMRDFERAVAFYDHAIKLSPRWARLHIYRGRSLAELGRHGDALAAFESAVGIDPRSADPHNAIGDLYMKQKRSADAKAAFERALLAEPFNGHAYLQLGWIAYDAKDVASARNAWENAIRFDNSRSGDTEAARRALENIGGPRTAARGGGRIVVERVK